MHAPLNRTPSIRSERTLKNSEDDVSTLRQPSPPPEQDDEGGEDGDYSSRMEDILGEDDEGADEDEDEEDGFLYEGEDAPPGAVGYRARLKDVLGPDADADETDLEEERMVEDELDSQFLYPGASDEVLSDHTPSTSSLPPSSSVPPSRVHSPSPGDSSSTPSRPTFLHPTVSRLRSFMPENRQRLLSTSSIGTTQSQVQNGTLLSPTPSHFSAISSRNSSVSNIHNLTEKAQQSTSKPSIDVREAFRWSSLKRIVTRLYPTTSSKTSSLIGSSLGLPTVLAVNGLICIGTDLGQTLVYDFTQQLKCVCRVDAAGSARVTALALSQDHTFIAVGHSTGHIFLYDLAHPQTPARSVPPTEMALVLAGRKEGHLKGSRITQLGFVGARHTAIFSVDETGLAFYHSLGKVLFVEANDVLRILGKYPENEAAPQKTPSPRSPSPDSPTTPKASHPPLSESIPSPAPAIRRPRKPRKLNVILSAAALPLGTSPDPTDNFNIIALLTPLKLVIVGLKPQPRTWYRRHREPESASRVQSRWRGCLAWFPSVLPVSENDAKEPEPKRKSRGNGIPKPVGSKPILVYSWGRMMFLLRVREEKVTQSVRDSPNSKLKTVQVGKLAFEEGGQWTIDSDILALDWLNTNQIIVLTSSYLEVFDIRTFARVERETLDIRRLISRPDPGTNLSNRGQDDHDHSHSLRVYKGKVFLLGRDDVKVGTLVTWADRILTFVQLGDFLSAIDVTRSYYLEEAPGNKNNLPEDPVKRREVIGTKLRELMLASATYAFSEDRMTDGTHDSADGRGVDRTALFEGLVSTCARACIALADTDFLFDDLYERYQIWCITPVFLTQLEPFILDGTIRSIPAYVTQQLVAYHEERHDLQKAERVIWHIDPECLDINQAIRLCQRHELYDALIYVYTSALRDYVSPLVELLGLVRKVQQRRRERPNHVVDPNSSHSPASYVEDTALETLVPNAYKIYDYVASVLSGLSYPSKDPIPDDDASKAKSDIYTFLFYGRSSVWPVGGGGKLVLTADEEGGVEPTYPYLRLLIRFDAEAFLHAMDIAFEDSYLNDGTQGVSRQIVINIMLEILRSNDLSSNDVTFLNIFIARNIPKYPQFIHTTPTALHGILVGLATDTDQSTREDRQLAAEFLLSAFTPHDGDRLYAMFEDAGFFRILRSWQRHERKWSALISTYLRDADVSAEEVFSSVDEILGLVSKADRKHALPPDVVSTVVSLLPQFLDMRISLTATLVETHLPDRHAQALMDIGDRAAHKQLAYLRCLIEPDFSQDLDDTFASSGRTPSTKLDTRSRHIYLSLLCRFDKSRVLSVLEGLPEDYLEWDEVIRICDQAQVFDVVLWVLGRLGQIDAVLRKVEAVDKSQAAALTRYMLTSATDLNAPAEIKPILERLSAMVRMASRICTKHSIPPLLDPAVLPEDIWHRLLHSQISLVQVVATSFGDSPSHQAALDTLRSLVQETFSSLMALPSSPALSFPRLFKRLVDSSSGQHPSSKYTEFRLILTGMLESYKSEGDLLTMTNRLVDRDLFDVIEERTILKKRGWRIQTSVCQTCGKNLRSPHSGDPTAAEMGLSNIIIHRSGLSYHSSCLPIEPSSH